LNFGQRSGVSVAPALASEFTGLKTRAARLNARYLATNIPLPLGNFIQSRTCSQERGSLKFLGGNGGKQIMSEKITAPVGEKQITIETGKLAQQADGAVTVRSPRPRPRKARTFFR